LPTLKPKRGVVGRPFEKGCAPGPGRPKGARDKLSRLIQQALLDAVEYLLLRPMVGTTNRSMAAIFGAWLRRKLPQPWEEGSGLWVIVLGDGRLSDRKAELEQLTMNVRGTPKHILNAHPSDQRPQVRIDLRPAT
jgi:uncharacterized protein with von Willebrand factor type A (vWA) domain